MAEVSFEERTSSPESPLLSSSEDAVERLLNTRTYRPGGALSNRRPLIEEIHPDNSMKQTNSSESIPNFMNVSNEDDTFSLKTINAAPGILAMSPPTDNDDNDTSDLLSTSLSILGAILVLGNISRPAEEEAALRGLLPSLQAIASKAAFGDNSEVAMDLAVSIMTRDSTVMKLRENNRQSADAYGDNNDFEKFCGGVLDDYLRSDQPAMRALGVKKIISFINEMKTNQVQNLNSTISMHRWLINDLFICYCNRD